MKTFFSSGAGAAMPERGIDQIFSSETAEGLLYYMLENKRTDEDDGMFDVLILSGGKQTRFKSELPKLLAQYKDRSVLGHNIETLRSIDNIGRIFVAENVSKMHFYEGIEGINMIELSDGFGCGKGCGDGVYHAMLKMKGLCSKNIIVCWSDIILDRKSIEHSIDRFSSDLINVPVVVEDRPYVGFLTENDTIKKVLFSRKGDDTSSANLHDLSFFLFSYDLGLKYLTEYEKNHMSEKEFSFLDIFNKFENIGRIIKITDSSAMAFNSVDELKKLVSNEVE